MDPPWQAAYTRHLSARVGPITTNHDVTLRAQHPVLAPVRNDHAVPLRDRGRGGVQRRRLADWQNDSIDSIRRYNVFTATVVRSPVVRGAMTAMHWIFRPPNEQVVVDSFGVALERCMAKLRDAGCAIPEALQRVAANPPASAEGLVHTQSAVPRARVV